MAIRTRWFDDQLEAALGMPVAGGRQRLWRRLARSHTPLHAHTREAAARRTGAPL